MITIHYVDGMWKGQTREFPAISTAWHFCKHLDFDAIEFWALADENNRYLQGLCSSCIKKTGLIW